MIAFLCAQVPAAGDAVQYGIAGAVLVIVLVFIGYLKQRDARDERIFEKRAELFGELSATVAENNAKIEQNTEVVDRLDKYVRQIFN